MRGSVNNMFYKIINLATKHEVFRTKDTVSGERYIKAARKKHKGHKFDFKTNNDGRLVREVV